MVKPTDSLPPVVSPVKSRPRSHFYRIISKITAWAATPQGLSLVVQGKMALKMAIASAISLVISQSLQWQYPFYAVIAAIIVMSSTHGSTLKLGTQRLIGTLIGAIAGAVFAIILGSSFWSLGICVFLTIFLASYWKYHEAAKLAGYVSAIVILSYSHSPWLYAWHRFLDTLLGIGVALLVNNLIFPARAGKELRCCLSQTLINLEQFYTLVVNCAFTGTYDRPAVNELKANIITSLRTGKELWQEVRQGQSSEPPETRVHEAWEFLIRRMWEHILAMEHTVLARQQDTFWQMLSPQITELAQETQNAMLTLAMAVKSTPSHISLPEIEIALAHATKELNQLQATKQVDDSIDELLRFFTFFYTMEEVGRKLQRMAVMLSEN